MPQAHPPPWAEVALSIYDLHGTSAINMVTKPIGLGGAFHIGLEIYWLEWSYGWTPRGTGVHVVHPGQSWQGSFRERITLGRTHCTPHELIALLTELRREWLGRAYHPLTHNCGHFCAELAKRVGVREVPHWINSLAATGERLAGWVDPTCLADVAVMPYPGLLGSVGSLALSEGKGKEEDDRGPIAAYRDLQDDPRIEKDWHWATEHMLSKAREAAGDSCVIS